MPQQSHIGVIGMATMGANLAQNIANNGFRVSVYNRTYERTEKVLALGNLNISGFRDLKEFVESLERPRNVILLVKSGQAVDDFIEHLVPLLEPGDTIIDCGNSNWKETRRRQEYFAQLKQGIAWIGCGISGGEEGALLGPSIMPGGSQEELERVLPILKKIAAKDFSGNPCVTKVGDGPSGHFVKMVHNGIEYAMMQGIAEIYDLLRHQNLSNLQMYEVFQQLNSGDLKSYLLDITELVLQSEDTFSSGYLLDAVSDVAGAKGTGAWTVEAGFEFGVAVPTISAAVFARVQSARNHSFSSTKIENPPVSIQNSSILEIPLEQLHKTLEIVYTVSYLQGLDLIIQADREMRWGVDIFEIIRIWQGGCIIRSQMLETIIDYYTKKKSLSKNLLLPDLLTIYPEVPRPVIHSVYNYISACVAPSLPTNLIQAQRDFFGAHGYTRIDRPGTFTGGWLRAQDPELENPEM